MAGDDRCTMNAVHVMPTVTEYIDGQSPGEFFGGTQWQGSQQNGQVTD